MIAVVQRVSRACVSVDAEVVGRIGRGLLVLLGVGNSDTDADVSYIVDKIVGLRVFADEVGRMNLNVTEAGGSVLAISQFTLLGDTRKGRRPNFMAAAPPTVAEALYDAVVAGLAKQVPTVQGRFGAMMDVALVNDGPVTIVLSSRREFSPVPE
ncbi:MAG: D-tyrosyl-tRNA(Tyr) deacylase [Caldilineaceae bacterium SB0665_bin_21]|nr:D-tyrosyl-tRNA(Tyr) deacylase [Caldilineaceae bacterium SB0665_bin_21]MYA05407.1 D-tyrosyl-tRNA(Tyr) deacylase [Caldilineaceae bacterium SB0664_bin_22]MYC62091.1 D-tyrosyl-tRNA(Tyr) deacylase [Caldilineaceae bacterium SB0661_bin_34]